MLKAEATHPWQGVCSCCNRLGNCVHPTERLKTLPFILSQPGWKSQNIGLFHCVGTVLLGNHEVKASDRTAALWKGTIYSCAKHCFDILTPVFPVQNKAICPEQTHCPFAPHTACFSIWWSGHFWQGCLWLVQLLCTNMADGDDGTREGRDPQTGYQEKSTGEMMYNCTSIHSAGAS